MNPEYAPATPSAIALSMEMNEANTRAPARAKTQGDNDNVKM